MTSPTIDFLITCVGKKKDEIHSLIGNGHYFGRVLVGNQGCEESSVERTTIGNTEIVIFNDPGFGVSKNRNQLIKRSHADYIVFLDDDSCLIDGAQDTIVRIINENVGKECVRFNVLSDNPERPIAQINRRGFVPFKSLTSVGVHGCFFLREALIESNLSFCEDMGPGTQYNHGEDTLFLRDYYRKKKRVFQTKELVITIAQLNSTWAGKNRNIPRELISQGFLYQRLFGWLSYPFAILFLLRKRYLFPRDLSLSEMKALIRQGIQEARNNPASHKAK